MFKINKKVEYAMMALRHISSKNLNELTSVKEICEKFGTPFDVTSRAMQKMVSGGILKSEKGAHGGYSLQVNLDVINFLDFMEMVVEPLSLVNCVESESNCSLSASCNIILPLVNLNKRMRDFFRTISLSEIMGNESCCPETEESCS